MGRVIKGYVRRWEVRTRGAGITKSISGYRWQFSPSCVVLPLHRGRGKMTHGWGEGKGQDALVDSRLNKSVYSCFQI